MASNMADKMRLKRVGGKDLNDRKVLRVPVMQQGLREEDVARL